MTILEQDPGTEAPKMTALVGEILNDVGRLIGQQAALFRAEVREDFRRTATAVRYFGLGMALIGAGGLFLAVAAVHGLAIAAPTLPVWGCWAIVGACLFLAGGTAALIGRRFVKTFNPLPNKTLTALEDNVSWITQPRS